MFNNDDNNCGRDPVSPIRQWRLCLLLFSAVVTSSAFSAGTPLEAYSPVGCSVWSLEDALPEDLTPPHSALPGTSRLRQVLSAGFRDALTRGAEPVLFMGQAFPKKKGLQPRTEQIYEVGCIRMQTPAGSGQDRRLQCHVEAGGRMEAYVFHILPPEQKNEPESYACKGECSGYPVLVVHAMPWEDGAASRQQARASSEYARRCLQVQR